MLKIRRPVGRLIFNMGIAIPSKTVFLIETAHWSWWMELWTGISTSRSWGIKCYHGWQGCLDITLCTSKKMPHPIQHLTRQPFWTNGMFRSWTGQFGVQTWTQLSMFGIKCQSGSETWMTPFHHSWTKQCCPPGVGCSSAKMGADRGREHTSLCQGSSGR